MIHSNKWKNYVIVTRVKLSVEFSGAIWGGSRVAMATPDQAVATPEFFGPMRRGGQEFIDILDFVYP